MNTHTPHATTPAQVTCPICGDRPTTTYPGIIPPHTIYRRRWWTAWRRRRYTCRGSYSPIVPSIGAAR